MNFQCLIGGIIGGLLGIKLLGFKPKKYFATPRQEAEREERLLRRCENRLQRDFSTIESWKLMTAHLISSLIWASPFLICLIIFSDKRIVTLSLIMSLLIICDGHRLLLNSSSRWTTFFQRLRYVTVRLQLVNLVWLTAELTRYFLTS